MASALRPTAIARSVCMAATLVAAGSLASGTPSQQGATPGAPPVGSGDPAQPAAASAPETAPPTLWVPRTKREVTLSILHGDYHVAVVGDELITFNDLQGFLRGPEFEDPTVGQADLSAEDRRDLQFVAAIEQVVEGKLKIQGGRNQGYDDAIIERTINDYFNRRVESEGGPQAFSAFLRQIDRTPEQFRGIVEQKLLAEFWEDSMTGRSPGGTGRAFVDRYVRPGALHARYRDLMVSGRPQDREIIGLQGPRVTIQQLVLPVASPDRLEETRRLAGALRENIAKGVLTFDGAVNEYGATSSRGEQSYLRDVPTSAAATTLGARHPGGGVAEFVRTGAENALSAPQDFRDKGVVVAVLIYALSDRKAPTEATPFSDKPLQDRLREKISEEASDLRIARGLGQLVLTTYVSPANVRDVLLSRGQRRAPTRR